MVTATPRQRTNLFTLWLSLWQMPLFRNGYALMLGSMITSALSVVYWTVAARYYEPEVVGLTSTLISAVTLFAGITTLSLPSALIRFTPTAGRITGRWILLAYLATLVATIVLTPLFGLIASRWLEELHFLVGDFRWQLSLIAVTAIWALFSLQDYALTGLRQAIWMPVENTIVALAKLGLLFGWAGTYPVWGILAAWALPMLLSLVPVNYFIFYHFAPQQAQRAKEESGARPQPLMAKAVVRYCLGNFPGSLMFLGYTMLLPLLVANLAGVRATAYFYMPWMLATGLQVIAQSLTTSLTVEGAHDERRLAIYCYRVLKQLLLLLTLTVAALLVGAPLLLSLFGADYAAEGSTLLRLLALALLPNVLMVLYLGVARVRNQTTGIIGVQAMLCTLLLGLSYWLLPSLGLVGVGWATLIAQSCVALWTLTTPLRGLLLHGYQASRTPQ